MNLNIQASGTNEHHKIEASSSSGPKHPDGCPKGYPPLRNSFQQRLHLTQSPTEMPVTHVKEPVRNRHFCFPFITRRLLHSEKAAGLFKKRFGVSGKRIRAFHQKNSTFFPAGIVRSLKPNRAVVGTQSCGRCGPIERSFFALTSQCEGIVQSLPILHSEEVQLSATRHASMELLTRSFFKISCRCRLTVFTLMESCSAMVLLIIPDQSAGAPASPSRSGYFLHGIFPVF